MDLLQQINDLKTNLENEPDTQAKTAMLEKFREFSLSYLAHHVLRVVAESKHVDVDQK